MVKIAILTNSFPFPKGEQFLENEIPYWADADFEQVYLLPANARGQPRAIPSNVKIDLCLTRSNKTARILYLVKALFSKEFSFELRYLIRIKTFYPYPVLQALNHTAKLLERAARLERFSVDIGGIDVAYSYWNDISSYAAVSVKNLGNIAKVISRIHGGDLYEERARYGYIPLKRQFLHGVDKLHALSPEGRQYLLERYGVAPEKVVISRLGVNVPPRGAAISSRKALHIVSVSYCVQVKRIDKIIDALALAADRLTGITISWTHIGDGPLLEQHKTHARQVLGKKNNVCFDFKGEVSNEDVHRFYENECVDLFVNASESEGIPVSIMEAMSYGVPAIAPDVGGIRFLVNHENGRLMNSTATVRDVADAIVDLSCDGKAMSIRNSARETIEDKFNAATNYSEFVRHCESEGRRSSH